MPELIHGDCVDIIRSMPSHSIDCIVTDPPYRIGTGTCSFDGGRTYIDRIEAARLTQGFDLSLLSEFLRVLKRPNLVVFCSRLQLREYLNWAHEVRLNWALICWHKTNPTPLCQSSYLPDTEYAFHFYKGCSPQGHYGSKRRFYVQGTGRSKFDHPTVKPLNIVKNLLLNAATVHGSVVLDPFMGSGTTGVAAIQLGHRFIGVERDGDYFGIAQRRITEARPDMQLSMTQKGEQP